MMNITKGGAKGGVGDSQDRLVVVHTDVKQGLDHREGEFGVLVTIECKLGLGFDRMPRFTFGFGTAEQSNIDQSETKTN